MAAKLRDDPKRWANHFTMRIPFRKVLEAEAKAQGRTLSNYLLWLLETHPERKGK